MNIGNGSRKKRGIKKLAFMCVQTCRGFYIIKVFKVASQWKSFYATYYSANSCWRKHLARVLEFV